MLDSGQARSTPKENLDESQPRNDPERWHPPRSGAIHPSSNKQNSWYQLCKCSVNRLSGKGYIDLVTWFQPRTTTPFNGDFAGAKLR